METMNRKSIFGRFGRVLLVGVAVGIMGVTATLAYAFGGGGTSATTTTAGNRPVATTVPAACAPVVSATVTPDGTTPATPSVVAIRELGMQLTVGGDRRLPFDCIPIYSVVDHPRPFLFA
jgi:hypothetical protein